MVLAGCGGGPGRIDVPGFSPSGNASQAMSLYDSDGDGFIAGEELDKAPELKAALATLDTDGDQKVSEAEIEARIQSWIDSKVGLTGCRCVVTLDGRPVKDAIVTFEPVEYLKGAIQPARGTTNIQGQANIKIPKDKRPSPDSPPGLQTGLYLIKVSKLEGGNEIIPARYNAETILGQQVAKDDPVMQSTRPLMLELNSD